MEVFPMLFILWIFMKWAESREPNHFRPQRCAYCPMGIHWDKGRHEWLHDTGEVWEVSMGQEGLHTGIVIKHPAFPPDSGDEPTMCTHIALPPFTSAGDHWVGRQASDIAAPYRNLDTDAVTAARATARGPTSRVP